MPLRKATYVKVSDLAPEFRGANLVAQVMSSNVVLEKARVDGSSMRIAEVSIADDTACVVLRARNDQIDKLVVGSTVVVRNAQVDMFKGYMRLVVTKWGKISPHPDGLESTPPAPLSVNQENNISSKQYELVRDFGHQN